MHFGGRMIKKLFWCVLWWSVMAGCTVRQATPPGASASKPRTDIQQSTKNECKGDTGRVTVAIVVSRDGKVLSATAVPARTNTHSACLVKTAERTAMRYIFDKARTGKAQANGTITFIFKGD